MKKIHITSVLFSLLFTVLLLIFIFSVYKIVTYNTSVQANKNETEELINKVVEIITIPSEDVEESESPSTFQVDFDELKSINNDTIGWIKYNQDKINYPIVKTTNNNYYLNHSFQRKNNMLGAIFMDYRNQSFNDKNVVIYGHNIKTGAMFGSLNDILKKDFWDNDANHIIELLNTNNELLKYQVFSYYTIKAEDYYTTTTFNNNDEYEIFLDTIKTRSLKNFAIEISPNDKILTLSTCHGAVGSNIRRVIHAKRIN